MTPPEQYEAPENLDDLQATDRLLSRLAERRPEPDDLDDPLFGAMYALAREVDHEETGTEDEAMRRLVDALGGRPLFVLDGEDVLDPQAGADLVLIDDPSWEDEPRPSRVIDLTSAVREAREEPAEPGAPAEEPAAVSNVAPLRVPAARTGVAAKLAAARPEGGWQAAARKLPLPVAAAIAVFALGGGITSALTGNPIPPATGIVDALPWQNDDAAERISLASVEDTLYRANLAVRNGNYESANELFKTARRQLESVSPAEAPQALAKFSQAVEAAPPAALVNVPPAPSAPPGGASDPVTSPANTSPALPTPAPTPTTPVQVTPTPTPTVDPTPSPSATETPVSTEPSTAVSPNAVATTP